MNLSKLKTVELRKVWKNEASDFTTWLAKEENLKLLSDEIGIDISLVQTEASVGRFSLDILAEEENTGRKIVIENQLESTNHDHLGKVITYASGFNAEIIIWIVKDVRDEHKQAVDWLNEHTDDEVNIFAIRMELWQIDNSPCAPKFQIVSEPNDWAKAVKKSTAQAELSERRLMQLEFWNQFREFAKSRKSALRMRKAFPQHWYDISIGTPKSFLEFIIDVNNSQIRCEFYIPDSKELYSALLEKKDEIERELDYKLEWLNQEGRKYSSIRRVLDVDVQDSHNWEKAFSWFMNTAIDFQKVFIKKTKQLKF